MEDIRKMSNKDLDDFIAFIGQRLETVQAFLENPGLNPAYLRKAFREYEAFAKEIRTKRGKKDD